MYSAACSRRLQHHADIHTRANSWRCSFHLVHPHTHTLACGDVHRPTRERPQGVMYTIHKTIPPSQSMAFRRRLLLQRAWTFRKWRKREAHGRGWLNRVGWLGKGKGIRKAMQASLGYSHAHHDSMHADERARAGCENRRLPGSRRWTGVMGGMSV